MQAIKIDKGRVKQRGERLHPIWWQGREWAVTSAGIERRDGCYFIEANRMGDNRDGEPEWILHIGSKGWDFDDFATAFIIGLQLHGYAGAFSPEAIRSAIGRAQREYKRAREFELFIESKVPAGPSGIRLISAAVLGQLSEEFETRGSER